MNKQPIEIRWHSQTNEITEIQRETEYIMGLKHGFCVACILCGSLFLIAVAAVWGW